jgi:aspartyl-tRNA(Asn)/glutamyl-tRNA(Gln) amidotransferase subunit B
MVVGLEVHVELSTNTKIYCGCSTKFGDAPNSHVCPICLGLPGSLPRLNKKVVEYAIMAGIAFNCTISRKSRMDRKNYFYPDCPKNYQITQDKFPLCRNGFMEIELEDGTHKRIGINRIHIEEDAAKLIHRKSGTFIDYNRAGVPLIEIVSEADIRSSEEAVLYLKKLREIVYSIGISDCKMEEGSLRCDANISVKQKGSTKLGIRTEIKNINSFKALKKALEYEYKRQISVIENHGEINQETRRWNDSKLRTEVIREKEYSKDYRYFPDGDLVTINITDEYIEEIKKKIPEMSYEREKRFIKEYNLSKHEAHILSLDICVSNFFEDTVRISNRPQVVANWIVEYIFKLLSKNSMNIDDIKFGSEDLAELIELVVSETISNDIGRKILKEMFLTGESPSKIARKKKLLQNNNEDEINKIVKLVINENQKAVEDYKNGKKRAVKFIIGLVMKKMEGKANPHIVSKLVKRELEKVK